MLRQISLQDSVVYGPIQSRRLGSSLGINPLPLSYKLCSSNCVYCQYGWTPSEQGVEPINPSTSLGVDPERVKRVERVKRAAELLTLIEQAFQGLEEAGTPVDCITLAGNGEPTLHPDLEEVILGVKALRDRCFPHAKVGMLSDGTQAHRPKVSRALALLDARYMKLDGGDEETWRLIDKPLGDASWPRLLATLKQLPDIILQSMFVQGACDNTRADQVDRWIGVVAGIRPLSVQVYTIDRAPADAGITKVPLKRLEEIAVLLTQRTGIPAEVYD